MTRPAAERWAAHRRATHQPDHVDNCQLCGTPTPGLACISVTGPVNRSPVDDLVMACSLCCWATMGLHWLRTGRHAWHPAAAQLADLFAAALAEALTAQSDTPRECGGWEADASSDPPAPNTGAAPALDVGAYQSRVRALRAELAETRRTT